MSETNRDREEIHYHSRLLTQRITAFQQEFGLCICFCKWGKNSPHTFAADPVGRIGYYSLSYVVKGRLALRIADTGEYFEAHENELLLIPPDRNFRLGKMEGEYLEDVVCFYGKLADMFEQCGMLHYGVYTFDMLRRPLQNIIVNSGRPAAESQLTAHVELLSLLSALHHRRQAGHTGAGNRIDALLSELEKNLNRDWSVAEMADFCNYRPTRFRELFLRQTGFRPKDYCDQLKIMAACRMLLGTGLPVGQIARQLGFDDPYHFSRRFAKKVGCPPSAYRRKNCGGSQPDTVID
ncbi:MAG: helix-turn-helix domain-containing protein [Victivallaceae bacterium]